MKGYFFYGREIMYTDITDLENLNKTLAKKDARVYLPRGPLSHEEDSLWGLFKDVPAEKTVSKRLF